MTPRLAFRSLRAGGVVQKLRYDTLNSVLVAVMLLSTFPTCHRPWRDFHSNALWHHHPPHEMQQHHATRVLGAPWQPRSPFECTKSSPDHSLRQFVVWYS